MNIKTLDKANEIARQIKEREKNLVKLQHKVGRRKQAINEHKNNKRQWLPFKNWFCMGIIESKESDKITFDAPMECEYPLHFELDEECVDLIIQHEIEKIEKLKKELEAL